MRKKTDDECSSDDYTNWTEKKYPPDYTHFHEIVKEEPSNNYPTNLREGIADRYDAQCLIVIQCDIGEGEWDGTHEDGGE